MKKILLVMLMLVLAVAIFADDAKVLPKGVIRAYVIPSYIFGSQEFDEDGKKIDVSNGDFKVFNLGAAVEYGVNDWITAALQWAPGTILYSDFSGNDQLSTDGAYELFVGAKLQFVGEKGLSQSDVIRFAVAPGIMVPMAFSYDAEEEAANLAATVVYSMSGGGAGSLEDYNVAPAKGAFGLGARIYADYIVNKMFFINLYAEYIKFLEKDAADDFYAEVDRIINLKFHDTVNYGYSLTTEVEFNFTKPISEGLSMSAGLPFRYEYSPEPVYDDEDPDSANAKYILAVNPNASLFVTSLPLPLEFKASYSYPLIGQNEKAKNVLSFQLRAYMKF